MRSPPRDKELAAVKILVPLKRVADPDNAGPRAVRATGRLCYASSNRAVTALAHLTRYARFRQRRGL